MATQEHSNVPTRDSMIARIRRAWARDSHLSLRRRAQKGVQLVVQLARGRVALKSCDAVGRNARVAGRMRVQNAGSIRIGNHLNVNSSWVPTELLTGPSGEIEIGDDVLINFGTVIAAGRSVVIGSGSMIGPHCIISDVDIPEAVMGKAAPAARPIEIGKDVWLAGRVTVRPGVRIGDGAVVVAGSIVESDVPAQVMASGIPARLLPKLGSAPRQSLSQGMSAGPITGAIRASTAPIRTVPRGVILSDFRLDDLASALAAGAGTAIDALALPIEDYPGSLAATPTADRKDFAIVWTSALAAMPALDHLKAGEPVADEILDSQVDAYLDRLDQLARHYTHVLVALWATGPDAADPATRSLRSGGVARAIFRANVKMIEHFRDAATVRVVDSASWHDAGATGGWSPRAWYLARIAQPPGVLVRAAHDLRAVIATLAGTGRRLLVLSANDVLWLRNAGGPMALPEIREAYRDFQRLVLRLVRDGLKLAVVGEGDAVQAREALGRLAGQLLSVSDIAAWSLGPEDIVAQVSGVADRLGVPLHEVTVIDTRAMIRARLRAALPDLEVPDWPDDVLLYASALRDLSGSARPASAPDHGSRQ